MTLTITKITIIVFLIMGYILFWFYHENRVNSLKEENRLISQERDDLYHKISSIEEGLISLGKQKPNNSSTPRQRKKTETKVKNSNVSRYTTNTNSVVTEEDVSLFYPNRTGEDLVNSLKLKTEL